MSDPFDFNKSINEIFSQATPRVSRFQRQRDIERSITELSPDFIEAKEIISAIWASLDRKYEQDISDIDHEMKQLCEQLDEADATMQREHDEWHNRLRTISEKE